MTTATLTSKGRITIPKVVRERLGVEVGDRIAFVEEEKGIFRVLAATKDVRHLKGLVSKPRRAISIEELNRAARRHGSRF
jgi:antitoxin PrlF